jgi:glycosyltransferase involved in cell wall biosynthesis
MLIIIKQYEDSYNYIWKNLKKRILLKSITLFRGEKQSNQNNRSKIFINLLRSIPLWLKIKYLKEDTLLINGWIFITYLFLSKLRLLKKPKRIIIFGYFVHNKFNFLLSNIFIKYFGPKGLEIIVFSKDEEEKLKKYFNNKVIVNYLFYSNVSSISKMNREIKFNNDKSNYLFSGGYSNRDYKILIEAIRNMPYKLIIACSRKNIIPPNVPRNVEIYFDISSEEFDQLIENCKIAILPLQNEIGASGQSVILRYMKFYKPIIATKNSSIQSYYKKNNIYTVPSNNVNEMRNAIKKLMVDNKKRLELSIKTKKFFIEEITKNNMTDNLIKIIKN